MRNFRSNYLSRNPCEMYTSVVTTDSTKVDNGNLMSLLSASILKGSDILVFETEPGLNLSMIIFQEIRCNLKIKC